MTTSNLLQSQFFCTKNVNDYDGVGVGCEETISLFLRLQEIQLLPSSSLSILWCNHSSLEVLTRPKNLLHVWFLTGKD